MTLPANILFKETLEVETLEKRYKICSVLTTKTPKRRLKFTIKTPERRQCFYC